MSVTAYHIPRWRPDPRIAVWKGDIVMLGTDAIVTAANKELAGCHKPGHCIDAAVFAAAGPELFEACRRLGGCATGEAKITSAFNLPSKAVIHTVGPIWDSSNQTPDATARWINELSSCYLNSLDLAVSNNLKSIAFCCISTGIFGFPKQLACRVALTTVKWWLDKHPDHQMLVVFNVFTQPDVELYVEGLHRYWK